MDILHVFEAAPSPPCAHTLSLHAADAKGVFDALVTILKVGLSVLHARDGVVDLSTLGERELAELRAYFASFCIELRVEVNRPISLSAGRALSDFQLLLRLPDRLAAVSFDYMRPDTRPRPLE